MNTRTLTQSIYNLFLVVSLLVAGMLSGNLAQAGNILLNPGFEADGNHGSGVQPANWNGNPGGPWYINSDSYAHGPNNYYKVWGAFSGNPNYQAMYQDNGCLPTSAFQASGWFYNIVGDSIFQSPDDYAWLEVSFRDAGNNILALYKSDIFSVSNTAYVDGVWYNLQVTNVCNPNPPYDVIGTTNLLVAPPGTVTVRYQHTYYQLQWGGGSTYFDDGVLNQTGGPVPPQISQVYPGNMLFASNHISFHVTSASSSFIDTNKIHLVVNGTDVSSGCKFTGATPDISVLYTNLTGNTWAYTASITVTDTYNFTATATMNFDTVKPSYVWEAEDYDFTNAVAGLAGQSYNSPILSSTPQANCYTGTLGLTNVDYYHPAAAAGPHLYRPNDLTGIGIAGETARQNFLTAQLTDPGVLDYTVGYIAINDWFNYTRDIPAGTYNVYARLAGGVGATTVSLDDVTTPGVTNNLGVFTFSGSDWGAYHYIPLADLSGNPLPITIGGHKILRVTLKSGGENQNFFMLVPAVLGLPSLSNLTPTNGTMFSSATALSFTATANGGTAINNNGIHVWLNGSDVSAALNITSPDSTNKNVSFTALAPNTIYTAVVAVTNVGGAGVSRTVTFDTMNPANFYVKVADYDYNGGAYDTNGNGLTPNNYFGDILPANDTGAVTNIDYHHDLSGNFVYRLTGLATELTSDVPLPGYVFGSDYDVGYFNNGDWGNYTRNYPAGQYLIYGRVAGVGQQNTALSKVTGGWGTTSQTLSSLGTWPANTGGWQNWAWVPLQQNGAPTIVALGGVGTLRVTSAGNCNANYFMLVPATGIQLSVAKPGSNVQISFPTQLGASYRVFWTGSLTSGTWSLLTTIPGTGTMQSASDPATGSQRYYKVTSP
jgi:hypothetical protein